MLAVEFKLTTRLVAPLGPSVPDVGTTVSQGAELLTVHDKLDADKLVNTKFCNATLNGPPSAPVAVKPVFGKINNGSGGTIASINGCPLGEPQAVADVTLPPPENASACRYCRW